MARVGQNRINTPYMTVYLVVSLPKKRIYTVYIGFWPAIVMANPTNGHLGPHGSLEVTGNNYWLSFAFILSANAATTLGFLSLLFCLQMQ